MTALTWHEGDRAVLPGGKWLIMLGVENGQPVRWYDSGLGYCSLYLATSSFDAWAPDAVPDFTHVGTAAAWLRSCAEVVPFKRNRRAPAELDAAWIDASFAIHAARQSPWSAHDPTLTARAVEATRVYLATLEGA